MPFYCQFLKLQEMFTEQLFCHLIHTLTATFICILIKRTQIYNSQRTNFLNTTIN